MLTFASALAGFDTGKDSPGAMLDDLLAMISPVMFERAMQYREPTPPDPDDLRAGSELSLLGYWAIGFRPPRNQAIHPPTAALLHAVAAYPARLPDLIPTLPLEREVFSAVKNIYDRSVGEAWCEEPWKSAVHDWLMTHSEYFRDDLIGSARLAIDKDGYVEASDHLEALAALDWKAAAPVLEELARSDAPRTAALALALLYEGAEANRDAGHAAELRDQLRQIAENAEAPGRAVDSAIRALLSSNWDGRDAWFYQLLENPSLGDLQDDSWGFAPLATAVEKDPDLWIPRISELVGSPNRIVHDHAVGILIRFQLESAREDALRPLLPWISDPTWSDAPDRLRLIQSVDEVGLREAIPGLILALERGDEWSQYIADTLGSLGAREGIPALRLALQRETEFYFRHAIIRALVEIGGFSVVEMSDAIERFAEQSSTASGREQIYESRISMGSEAPLDLAVQIGEFVVRSDFQPSEELAKSLLARIPTLEATKPGTAESLKHLLADWTSHALDQYFVEALLSGRLDAATTSALLLRREAVRANALELLRKSLLREGVSKGIGAIMLQDSRAIRQVLQEGSSESRIALFAAARIVDHELPPSLVRPLLLGSDDAVSKATERYLETNDGVTAREILWQKYPGRAWILGHSVPGDPKGLSDSAISKRELALRQDLFRADGPDEIFAWISKGHWSGRSWREIRFAKGVGQLTCQGASRELSAAESALLLNVVTQRSIDDLGYFTSHVTDCAHVEYLHLTRDRGRRVVMYCPAEGAGSDHFVLSEIFESLACPQEAETDRLD